MKIYLDLVFFINFFNDLLILLTIGIILKRHINYKRIFLSSFLGLLSLAFLFIDICNTLLFIFKLITSFLMVIIAYKYVSFKYFCENLIYFYMISIILAGFIYFLSNNLSLDNNVLYILCLLFLSPLFVYFYIKDNKKIKLNNYCDVVLEIFDKKFILYSYLDTGNLLTDPITGKKIILVSKWALGNINIKSPPIYVSCKTLNKDSLLKCYKPKKVIVNKKEIKNLLVGICDYEFNNGIKCLLNESLMEELC